VFSLALAEQDTVASHQDWFTEPEQALFWFYTGLAKCDFKWAHLKSPKSMLLARIRFECMFCLHQAATKPGTAIPNSQWPKLNHKTEKTN
jgi:hypothetical protein